MRKWIFIFLTLHFNSRPHGGRRSGVSLPFNFVIFQLTPSRRATGIYRCVNVCNIFQLTPSRRATADVGAVGKNKIFQLTPSRRAT